MDIIKIEGVSKRYESHQVLKNLTLDIKRGECFTLLGPSGCGKTVLLRLIAGFEMPDEGKITIGDTVVADGAKKEFVPPDQRGMGVVFQDYAVWPHMTVFNNVAYPLKIAKLPKEEIKERVMRMLALVGMENLDQRKPSELSGGQQQRVALARALVAQPSILLLDEPLSNLDANLREEMRFEIKELQRKLDITVLYVTHDQEIALAIADRVAVMDESGNIVQTGTPWEIFERPTSPFIFNFMGTANYLPIEYKNGVLQVQNSTQVLPWTQLPSDESKEWVGGFRPSDVVLSRQETGLKGTIKRASFLGSTMHYLIDIDGHEINTAIETQEAVNKELIFQDGDICYVTFLDMIWFEAAQLAEVVK